MKRTAIIETTYNKIHTLIEQNHISLFIFFSSLFIFIGFAGTRLFISDDGITLNQFYNFIHGSISLENWKINTAKGVYLIYNNHLYGKFSYSLIILSYPTYYILRLIEFIYGAHLFLLQLWALSGGIIAYLIVKNRNVKNAELVGALSYFILISTNMFSFKPIYFPVWGELLSIEFTNILISSFVVLFVYLLFKNFFSNKIAIFASFFILFATPITFYGISLKHHSLSLFLTILAFYFFYKYNEKKENKFIFYAYILAGLCVWTRVLDGAILLTSLLIVDLFIFKRGIKYIIYVLIIILISLLPFFIFNYLILDNPFSIIEITPSNGNPVTLSPGRDVIILDESFINSKPSELLKRLGYTQNVEPNSDLQNILLDTTILRVQNTFGIFLISPFLIIALAFVIDLAKQKLNINTIDKFFGLYIILFIYGYKNYLLSIITDTPHVLDYRYLLVMYIILLYFVFRIDKIKKLIENKLKPIVLLYSIILTLSIIYFIKEFPIQFMNVYYNSALITSVSLIILVAISLLLKNETSYLLDKLILFGIAASLALSSFFLLFYYWIVSMTYISPSLNHTILPVLENILKWMYQIIR